MLAFRARILPACLVLTRVNQHYKQRKCYSSVSTELWISVSTQQYSHAEAPSPFWCQIDHTMSELSVWEACFDGAVWWWSVVVKPSCSASPRVCCSGCVRVLVHAQLRCFQFCPLLGLSQRVVDLKRRSRRMYYFPAFAQQSLVCYILLLILCMGKWWWIRRALYWLKTVRARALKVDMRDTRCFIYASPHVQLGWNLNSKWVFKTPLLVDFSLVKASIAFWVLEKERFFLLLFFIRGRW